MDKLISYKKDQLKIASIKMEKNKLFLIHKNEHKKCKIILLKNADTRLKSLIDR